MNYNNTDLEEKESIDRKNLLERIDYFSDTFNLVNVRIPGIASEYSGCKNSSEVSCEVLENTVKHLELFEKWQKKRMKK